MIKRRVVVTGLGTINPLANSIADTWDNLLNGVSGIDYITAFDTSTLQQTSSNELHYSPKQTMKYAQELYENDHR